MAFASLLYFSHSLYFHKLIEVYYYFDSIYLLCNLLVFPLYQVYVRLLTVDKTFTVRKHFKFFAAPLLLFLLSLGGLCLNWQAGGIKLRKPGPF